MLLIGIERTGAGVAKRIVRIDGLIAHGAQIALMAGVRDSELVRAGEDVAGGMRVRIEALQLELWFRGGRGHRG